MKETREKLLKNAKSSLHHKVITIRLTRASNKLVEAIKEIGFYEDFKDFQFFIPSLEFVKKWFREEKMIKVIVGHAESNGCYKYTIWRWNFDNNIGKWERISNMGTYIIYDAALEVGLLEACKLI